MSGNFKIRYTSPLSSGGGLANKLESYFSGGLAGETSSTGAAANPGYNFQRALHKGGVATFTNAQTTPNDISANGCIIDLSGGFLRVRAVDSLGNVSTVPRFIDCSLGIAGLGGQATPNQVRLY
jgi:hypothetical protein